VSPEQGKELNEGADARSGGVYVYFWPRNAPNVPDDVRVCTVSAAK
jgi:hypothetical protein